MQIDLKGKIALITGASGQLGRTIARTLSNTGADVAVHYVNNKETADAIAAELKEKGRRAIAVRADVTDYDSVIKMRDEIYEKLGKVNIVVNNAVIQYKWVSVIDQPLEDFKSQFDSCVMQSVHTAKAFLPFMKENGGGRFIGINTERSALCTANSAAYSSAKRGMDGLYRVLANEVGPYNITVNQVAPGWTISEKDRVNGEIKPSPDYTDKVPLRRRGTDQEIANGVLFFASNLSDFVTGVCLPVSGGAVMA